ncbi:MAG: cytidine deaminase, partial [Chryseobacterium sp.]
MRKDIHIGYEHFKNSNELSEIEQALFEKAKSAREKAYAPYSDFFVGCAILLENGDIFSGSNQENAAFPSGLCAERTTLYWV